MNQDSVKLNPVINPNTLEDLGQLLVKHSPLKDALNKLGIEFIEVDYDENTRKITQDDIVEYTDHKLPVRKIFIDKELSDEVVKTYLEEVKRRFSLNKNKYVFLHKTKLRDASVFLASKDTLDAMQMSIEDTLVDYYQNFLDYQSKPVYEFPCSIGAKRIRELKSIEELSEFFFKDFNKVIFQVDMPLLLLTQVMFNLKTAVEQGTHDNDNYIMVSSKSDSKGVSLTEYSYEDLEKRSAEKGISARQYIEDILLKTDFQVST